MNQKFWSVGLLIAALALSGCGGKDADSSNFLYDFNAAGDGLVIQGYTGSGSTLIIPAEIEGYPVREIGAEAFSKEGKRYGGILKTLAAVVIPENVQIIRARAFFRQKGLKTVSLPASLAVIEREAFRNTGLKELAFPDGLAAIGEYAFAYTRLQDIDLSQIALTEISDGCFSSARLIEVKLSRNITKIGHDAFSDCAALTGINIPENIREIGANAFYNCVKLNMLDIPANISAIEWQSEEFLKSNSSNAFKGCLKLPLAVRRRLLDLGYTDSVN